MSTHSGRMGKVGFLFVLVVRVPALGLFAFSFQRAICFCEGLFGNFHADVGGVDLLSFRAWALWPLITESRSFSS